MKKTYVDQKAAAREKSLHELAEWCGNKHFSTLAAIRAARRARRYGLVREFRARGIM